MTEPREPVTEAGIALWGWLPHTIRRDWPEFLNRILAIEAEASRAAGLREAPTGTRLVLVSEDAERLFFGRDDDGNRLTFEWGEPDEHGWYTPTVTVHIGEGAAPGAAPAEPATEGER